MRNRIAVPAHSELLDLEGCGGSLQGEFPIIRVAATDEVVKELEAALKWYRASAEKQLSGVSA